MLPVESGDSGEDICPEIFPQKNSDAILKKNTFLKKQAGMTQLLYIRIDSKGIDLKIDFVC